MGAKSTDDQTLQCLTAESIVGSPLRHLTLTWFLPLEAYYKHHLLDLYCIKDEGPSGARSLRAFSDMTMGWWSSSLLYKAPCSVLSTSYCDVYQQYVRTAFIELGSGFGMHLTVRSSILLRLVLLYVPCALSVVHFLR